MRKSFVQSRCINMKAPSINMRYFFINGRSESKRLSLSREKMGIRILNIPSLESFISTKHTMTSCFKRREEREIPLSFYAKGSFEKKIMLYSLPLSSFLFSRPPLSIIPLPVSPFPVCLGNASKPIPYKTEKALLPEPVFHPTTMSITPILNMYQVAITLDYRYQPVAT